MNVPRRRAHRRFNWRLAVAIGVVVMFISSPAAMADSWYEHYASAEQALDEQDWARAVEHINSAIGRRGDSGVRVRSYGMNVVAYFPYLKLGIAYYHLGQYDAALQAFETETRLGAIAESGEARAELDRYRSLAGEARVAAAAKEQQRIAQIVGRSLEKARALQGQGLWDEATAALDQALAVAPDDAEAVAAMQGLRERIAAFERERERDRRAASLVDAGKALVDEGRYDEASSLFREAQYLKPSPAVQALLRDAQSSLRAQLEKREADGDRQSSIGAWLEEVDDLEAAGRLSAALDRLQRILVLEPDHRQALAAQQRLLARRGARQLALARQAALEERLAEAAARLDDGAVEEALAAANHVLALDPGNAAALQYIARAYGVINRRLLGTADRSNIPPAVRFVDLRGEDAEGLPVETVRSPDFQLRGVVIDDSPVDVSISIDGRPLTDVELDNQPLGEFFITEFGVASDLAPGRSAFRLVATDAENLSASSEYAVLYARPWYRAPWFLAGAPASVAALGFAALVRRARRQQRLRKRRFNPYVAGAPVVDDGMFFGRENLVERILQTIHNNSLLIYGERRIGKTSIQHQVKKRLAILDDPFYAFYPVYVDLQGTPESAFFRTIAEDVFDQLGPVLDGLKPAAPLSGAYAYRDFVHDLRAVLKVLQSGTAKKVRLVLLIDEVDELNDYDPRINQKLRSLFMKSFAENLVAVVSGVEIKKQWEREGSPWYNFFEEIEVQPLAPRDARELIERPIGGMFKVDGSAAERIVALTAGKPYLIQKMCIALVTRLHEQHRRKITLADVEALGGASVSHT